MHRVFFLFATMLSLGTLQLTYGAEFYVSPQGDDGSPGTLEEPFKTLDRARDAVRTLKKQHDGKTPDGGVTIWLRGGRYELVEPFVLGPEDSGREGAPTVYRAYAEERPLLSGGRVIRGWRKVEGPLPGLPKAAQEKVWVADVPEAKDSKWSFRQLWANGKRSTRARWPNQGETGFQIVDVSVPKGDALKPGSAQDRWLDSLKRAWRTVQFRPEDLKAFPDGKLPDDLGNRNAEVFTMVGGRWATMRIPIGQVKGLQLTTAVPMGFLTHYWGGMHLMPGRNSGAGTGYVENALSLLDAVGEWYLDAGAGRVYYLPSEGEDPNAEEFVAPKLEQLLCLRGNAETPVRFVELRGVRFEHAEWRTPEFGYRPILFCMHGTQFTPVVMPESVVSGSLRPKDETPEFCLPAAVDLVHAERCVLESCHIGRVGASGIGMAEGCRSNRVTGCEAFDTGGHGIHVGSAHGTVCGEDFGWKRPEDQPLANEISNCRVHHTGEMDWGAAGILSTFSRKTRIAHNLVEDVPYAGIGGCLSFLAFRPGWEEEVTIEYNHIHHAAQRLFDTGGIYTEGIASKPSALSVIRGNLIHDIGGNSYQNNGIFLDDESHGCYLEDNMVRNVMVPVRFNRTSQEKFTWGKNYFGTPNPPASAGTKTFALPTSPPQTGTDFPRELAAKAGPEEPYRSLLLGKP